MKSEEEKRKDPKWGIPRHTKSIYTPQGGMADDLVVTKPKQLSKAIVQLESNLNEIDISTYNELKFLHSGDNFPKNPANILSKLEKIKLDTINNVNEGSVKDSKRILLELLAIFSTNYKHYIDE